MNGVRKDNRVAVAAVKAQKKYRLAGGWQTHLGAKASRMRVWVRAGVGGSGRGTGRHGSCVDKAMWRVGCRRTRPERGRTSMI